MFIEVQASFQSDDQPNFELLEREPTLEDFNNSDWRIIYVNINHIVSMFENEFKYTNIFTINDECYTVKEPMHKVMDLIRKEQGSKFNLLGN